MKRKTLSLLIVLLFACSFVRGSNLTHAEAESRQWKGIDVSTVLGNNAYETKGKKIYLYNVGTGKFVIEGGNWGMEGRLFHEDFGRQMQLKSDGFIKSGITEAQTATKVMYGCNVPGASKPNATWAQTNKFSFTAMLDADSLYLQPWNFQRVETDPDATTYTYYLWETMKDKKNVWKNYYLGAAYGEWDNDDKGHGQFVYLDADRSCWTTGDVIGNQTEKDVDGDMIPIAELYQWRLISEEEFIAVLNEETVGINPSISSLVPDRDFPRNSDEFESSWVTSEKADYTYGANGRFGYTHGYITNTLTQTAYNYVENNDSSKYFTNEAWDKPIRLKEVFDEMKTAKYGYLFFEGVGRTYTSFVVPKPGWYLVQCYGFVQSDNNNDAYFFAKVAGSNGGTSFGGESTINLVKVPKGTFKNKNGKNGCVSAGQALTLNGSNYKNTVWICVTDEQFNSGDVSLRTLQVGVGKDVAKKSNNNPRNNVNYYYDTDWVCIDDIRVSYMGLGPVFFYEDEEDLEYLRFDETNLKQLQSAAPTGRYGGGVNLERSLKKDQWNSFSFPLPLTGEQIRYAFGEDATLAKINSIGNLSLNDNVIDFETIDLRTTENVVEPGNFYLLKPTADPIPGEDPRGNETTYYELGRMFFSVNGTEDPNEYPHPVMSLEEYMVTSETIDSYQGLNDGHSTVTYTQTPDFATFSVNSDGSYTGNTANGRFAPNGSYVVSNNTIFHLSKDTRIKGFRGWINLTHPIEQQPNTSMIAIYGVADNGKYKEILSDIGLLEALPLRLPDSTAVYDLSGRKVGTLSDHLPKGIYIVCGKKFVVR